MDRHTERLAQLGLLPPRCQWPQRARWHDEYQPIDVLGAGAFGRVLLARRRDDGAEVAVKVHLSDEPLVEEAELNAMAVMRTQPHPNVAEAIDYFLWAPMCTDDVPEALRDGAIELGGRRYAVSIVEYVRGLDLAEYIASTNEAPPADVMRLMLRSAASGLAAMHAAGLVHRDIKPENMRLRTDDEGELVPDVVLIDLGLACTGAFEVTDHAVSCLIEPGSGTLAYQAPEVQDGDYAWTQAGAEANDVWALGLALSEVALAAPRWFGADDDDGAGGLPDYDGEFPSVLYADDALVDALLRNMLHRDPARRPTAEQIVEALD